MELVGTTINYTYYFFTGEVKSLYQSNIRWHNFFFGAGYVDRGGSRGGVQGMRTPWEDLTV
jgi:hypothetical protein